MNFLIDLIKWFLYGKTESTEEPVHSEPAENVIELEVVKAEKPKTFLDELRAIKPIERDFDQAKDELVDELKKLAPKKKSIKRKS